MKTEHKTSRIKHIFLILILVLWCWAIGSASAEECFDLIVDGEVTVEGGCYGVIFVKNNGKLTSNGDTTAYAILVQWGTMTVNGNLDVADYITVQANPAGTVIVNGDASANRISIEGGTLTINGAFNVSQITVQSGKLTVPTITSSQERPIESVTVESGQLHLRGNWFVNDMTINGGVVYVIPYSGSLEGSGTFVLECDQLTIEADGVINANSAGGDTRGIGADVSRNGAGGGGYGSKGGDGGGGNTYGDPFSPTIEMGSRGGNSGNYKGGKGGGSISIISTGNVAIYGTITANGGNGLGHSNWSSYYAGGGSGGGVLILSQHLELSGSIAANGGTLYAGGGGGRIKLFYETGVSIDDISDKVSGGTIWTDAIPNPPELIAPEEGAPLASHRPTFKFSMTDTSVDTDNRDDDLSCIIELSVDNFATIYKIYDQNTSLSGWSKFSYKSGDQAEFTPTGDLPEGVYQWRAAARDRSVRSDFSAVRSFTLGTPPTIEVNASPSSLPPDGESTSVITATVTDEGNPVTDEVVTMTLDGDGTLSEVTNNGDGTYTATYTAGTTPGTVTITVTATNSNVSDTVEINLGAPSSEGTLTIAFIKGLNMISLPNHPDTPYTAKSFAEEIGDTTLIIRFDNVAKEWVSYLPGYDTDDGFSINGGGGYIVNVTASKDVAFTGAVWDDANAAPHSGHPNLFGDTWAFVVAGELPIELRDAGHLTVSVRNSALTERSTYITKSHSAFRVVFVDSDRRAVVETGGQLLFEVTDADGRLVAEKQVTIDPTDLANAYKIINPRYNPIPDYTALLQNYPNPFNPETWIPFQLSESANITISIYDISGKLIRTLFLGDRHAGIYTARDRAAHWDGRNGVGEKVSSGVYFYRINAGKFYAIKRMAILK